MHGHTCLGGSYGIYRNCRSWYGKETLLEVEDQKAWRDGHGQWLLSLCRHVL